MAYNHSRKAGNRGDVWKHCVLVALADTMCGSRESFGYVECHAGAPIHELIKHGEWWRGVGRVAKDALGGSPCYVGELRRWLARKQYPASWIFVAKRLARRFARVEVSLFDRADDVAAQYPPPTTEIPSNVRLIFRQADGYAEAARLDSADLVFLDPPYHPDSARDWRQLRQACLSLQSRGVAFAAWYPFFWPTRPQELVDTTGCVAWEVTWATCGSKPSQNLKGCGMLVSSGLAVHLARIERGIRSVGAGMGAEMVVRRPAAS